MTITISRDVTVHPDELPSRTLEFEQEEHTLESSTPAAIERALEDDVLRVSAELQQPGEGGESPMLEVQIMAITGDVFPVQVSRDDTVRNRCRQQQGMNCSCVSREQRWSSRRRWRCRPTEGWSSFSRGTLCRQVSE